MVLLNLFYLLDLPLFISTISQISDITEMQLNFTQSVLLIWNIHYEKLCPTWLQVQ